MVGKSQFSRFHPHQRVFFTALALVTAALCSAIASAADDTGSKAVIIDISPSFTQASLKTLDRQIDRAAKSGADTVVFRFAGAPRRFDSLARLARQIVLLTEKDKWRTVAWVPSEAKGMAMLGVFACQEVAVDSFAQLGQVIPPKAPPKTSDEEEPPVTIDEQTIVNKIENIARSAGHDPLLARAMTAKRMMLYQISRGEEKMLVDQNGFEKMTRQTESPWTMIGSGPLVGADEVLLLSGRQAHELGLAQHLVADETELADALAVTLIDTPRPFGLTDPNETEPNLPLPVRKLTVDLPPRAVVIVIDKMVDEGLYESIKRRTEEALDLGATCIVYQIDTFGGRVDSAIKIWDYFMHDVSKRAQTVAYVPTKAISAGALISVACQDIIMKTATNIGDCAPISMGGTLEGVEREKMESPLRTYFKNAAEKNGYPLALCAAMVTISHEVYEVPNLETGKNEYFEAAQISNLDPYTYDLDGKKLICDKDELVTLRATEARQYGLARVVVDDLEGVLTFLEQRGNVKFPRPAVVFKSNWSEELVRWITSPTVAGILLMVAMLGIYAELNSPGLGLPGAVAVAALIVLFGSKFLIGMANWWEIALFMIGLALLMMEIFVIPGFGIAGISGVLMILFSLVAMMVGNAPDQLPIPASPVDWALFESHLVWACVGFLLFVVCAYFLARYLPQIPVANRIILNPPEDSVAARAGGRAAPAPPAPVAIGDQGIALTPLRPSGNARFGHHKTTVISRGELINAQQKIQVIAIEGNSIIVRQVNS